MKDIKHLPRKIKINNAEKCIYAVMLTAYSFFMIYLLFFKNRIVSYGRPVVFGHDIKLVPFVTISEFMDILMTSNDTSAVRHSVINLAGNVIMFVPYGFFLPVLFEKCRKYGHTLLVSGLGICIIEMAQLFTRRGICDIDDLLLNLIGVSLGFALFLLYATFLRKRYGDTDQ